MVKASDDAAAGQRLDRWLWVSRLCATRTLATQSVAGGKVRVNGQPVKPARVLRLGDEVSLWRGNAPMTVVVRGYAPRRVPAKEVPALYEETAESLAKRQQLTEQRALSGPAGYSGKGRPTKQQRRALQRLTDK
ncbi:MAG TPA: RNA-binding protein [Gammaproteobacteria bacterium]|uniref:RNA-binding S4 domain-containing protein n=1 Tax=Immundisolibacter sp. TaxID=1934948 RepID=UPI000E923D2F|nr:RNA-binding protein [Gammaproteobacteria bacterium]HCZ47564.1 RNA-binding protein [Gammaproteobacteria bacterium]MCH77002.1 RNA-binding protein [Gammaproteobacteria bacterium]